VAKDIIQTLLLENIHEDAVTRFKQEGYAVEHLPKSLNEQELSQRIKNISTLGIRSKTEITSKVLENANELLAVGIFGIGTDKIDLGACLKKGIAVFNAPYSSGRSVAEFVIGAIIMLLRNVFDKSNKLRCGTWDKSAKGSHEVRGKKLGIIGYGNIGSQLSILAESLGMKVYYYDVVERQAFGYAKKCNSLEELLRSVDVVSLHSSGGSQNKNLIGEKEFEVMRDDVIFVNTSRGYVVDIKALAKYIKNGKVKGAAIDVYPQETQSSLGEIVSEFQLLPNVILTPHIGGSTEEAQQSIAEFMPDKIIEYIKTGDSLFSVNFPNTRLQEMKNAHRFVHIHKNVPGILAQINGILGKYNINIMGQSLGTNEKIGYVIIDGNRAYDGNVATELEQIPQTIRFKVLY